MQQVTVYIKASGNSIVYDKNITIGDVIKIECTNIGIRRAIKQMDLHRFDHPHGEIFSILKVIERIHKDYSNVEVVNCGETDFMVEYIEDKRKSPIVEKLKLAVVAIVVFFGSAFTIMTFHNDIGIKDVFTQFYEQVMGTDKPKVSVLEISYSIGLLTGIMVFFNHFGKKKLSKDPTPIEVEMKKYNKDVIMTKIADSDEKGHTIDVS